MMLYEFEVSLSDDRFGENFASEFVHVKALNFNDAIIKFHNDFATAYKKSSFKHNVVSVKCIMKNY